MATTFDLRWILFVFVLVSPAARFVDVKFIVDADSDSDKEECTQELVGMATCLAYVGGKAKAPTPDCCSGLKQVLKNKKKCLCVIIEDRDDPELGLKINVTIALGLPAACHTPANVSQCPGLLKLPPNSPEAQVFYQLGKGSSAASPSSPAPDINSTVEGARSGSKVGPERGEACCRGKNGLGLATGVIAGLLLWTFVDLPSI